MALTLQVEPMTPAERLVEAEAAYHTLQIGLGVAEITDQSGERIRYTTANASRLAAYIKELKAEIAGQSGPIRPMRPLFL